MPTLDFGLGNITIHGGELFENQSPELVDNPPGGSSRTRDGKSAMVLSSKKKGGARTLLREDQDGAGGWGRRAEAFQDDSLG